MCDGIDVLPHCLAVARNFKYRAANTKGDKGIAVRLALRTADVRTEEIRRRIVGVLPEIVCRAVVGVPDA